MRDHPAVQTPERERELDDQIIRHPPTTDHFVQITVIHHHGIISSLSNRCLRCPLDVSVSVQSVPCLRLPDECINPKLGASVVGFGRRKREPDDWPSAPGMRLPFSRAVCAGGCNRAATPPPPPRGHHRGGAPLAIPSFRFSCCLSGLEVGTLLRGATSPTSHRGTWYGATFLIPETLCLNSSV